MAPYPTVLFMALNHLKINFEASIYNHETDSKSHRKLNPQGKLPVLILPDQDLILYETLPIIEYLETLLKQRYSDVKDLMLFPADPVKRAMARMKIARLESVTMRLGLYFKVGLNGSIKGFEQAIHDMENILEDGRFFGGQRINIVDIAVYPWVDRLYYIQEFRDVIDRSDIVSTWYARASRVPSVATGKVDPLMWQITIRNQRARKHPLIWPVRELTSPKNSLAKTFS